MRDQHGSPVAGVSITCGNAVPGAAVAWVSKNGGILCAATTVTGNDGLADITLTIDQSTTYTIMAELQNNASVVAVFTEMGS